MLRTICPDKFNLSVLFFLALFCLKTMGYDAETYEMLGRNL